MGIYVFGAGSAQIRVLDSAGVYQGAFLPTLKEASVKFDGKLESQFGSAQYAEDAASGERKITGSIKLGQFEAGLFNDIIFGGTKTAGAIKIVQREGGNAGIAPTANVVTPANVPGGVKSAFVDMGVVSAVDGYPMRRIAAAATLAAGQYKYVEATGLYTFTAADPRAAFVRVYYRYFDNSVGYTYDMGNPLQGVLADCELMLYKPRFTKNMGILLYHAVLNGLDLSSKGGSYTDPSATFECFIDPVIGSPGQTFTTEND